MFSQFEIRISFVRSRLAERIAIETTLIAKIEITVLRKKIWKKIGLLRKGNFSLRNFKKCNKNLVGAKYLLVFFVPREFLPNLQNLKKFTNTSIPVFLNYT
ncbi:MAG: hypothetical protein K5640_07830 [Treponema sp.]|nr:hypothetical protein [Treponema sp.]